MTCACTLTHVDGQAAAPITAVHGPERLGHGTREGHRRRCGRLRRPAPPRGVAEPDRGRDRRRPAPALCGNRPGGRSPEDAHDCCSTSPPAGSASSALAAPAPRSSHDHAGAAGRRTTRPRSPVMTSRVTGAGWVDQSRRALRWYGPTRDKQRHLDRLTAIDASFLHQEGPASHMHIGALVRADGPAPRYNDFLDSIRTRLHLVPRYRQRLVYPPANTGRPLWMDDTDFSLGYHVRHTALPGPGSDEQLMDLSARDLLPAAGSLQAAVGALARRGPRRRRLRAALQEPPRDDRRHRGRRPRHGPLRPQPRAGADADRPRPVGAGPRAQPARPADRRHRRA